MLEILQWIIFIGVIIVLVKEFKKTRQLHELFIILSGLLLLILKLSLPYLPNQTVTLILSLITLVICCISGWLVIKRQK